MVSAGATTCSQFRKIVSFISSAVPKGRRKASMVLV